MATMKIAAHTILEILGFSDIDNLAVFIFMDITTRAIWQQLQFMFNQFIHGFIIAKRLLHCLLGRLGKEKPPPRLRKWFSCMGFNKRRAG